MGEQAIVPSPGEKPPPKPNVARVENRWQTMTDNLPDKPTLKGHVCKDGSQVVIERYTLEGTPDGDARHYKYEMTSPEGKTVDFTIDAKDGDISRLDIPSLSLMVGDSRVGGAYPIATNPGMNEGDTAIFLDWTDTFFGEEGKWSDPPITTKL